MSDFIPAEAIHPGEFIRDEMEARGWTVEDLWRRMHFYSIGLIRRVIDGRVAITPDIAQALSKAFGSDVDTWLRLQAAYNRYQERARHETPD